jgi:hypothetical protein
MAPVSFEYSQAAQTSFKPPLIANENAFLGDVFTSEGNDPQAPISAGFYRLEKGKPSNLPKKPKNETRTLADQTFPFLQAPL